MKSAIFRPSILVFHTEGNSALEPNATLSSSGILSAPNPAEFAHQLKCLEMEKVKLMKQLKNKTDEIGEPRLVHALIFAKSAICYLCAHSLFKCFH